MLDHLFGNHSYEPDTKLVQEYISKNLSTENLKVIVGFTSPERKDFYYKDEKD